MLQSGCHALRSRDGMAQKGFDTGPEAYNKLMHEVFPIIFMVLRSLLFCFLASLAASGEDVSPDRGPDKHTIAAPSSAVSITELPVASLQSVAHHSAQASPAESHARTSRPSRTIVAGTTRPRLVNIPTDAVAASAAMITPKLPLATPICK